MLLFLPKFTLTATRCDAHALTICLTSLIFFVGLIIQAVYPKERKIIHFFAHFFKKGKVVLIFFVNA